MYDEIFVTIRTMEDIYNAVRYSIEDPGTYINLDVDTKDSVLVEMADILATHEMYSLV